MTEIKTDKSRIEESHVSVDCTRIMKIAALFEEKDDEFRIVMM